MAAELLARPTWNPADVLSDGRVVMTGVGLVAAHTKRKIAYTQFRGVFGWASKVDGQVKFLDVDANGNPTSQELPGAYGNRLLLNASDVVAGTLLIGQVQDANVDYLGLGLAAGGIANIIMTLLGVE